MIYLIFGEDTRRSHALLLDFIGRFRKEVPHAWRRIDCEEEENLPAGLGGSSLFAKKDFLIFESASLLSPKSLEPIELLLARWQSDDSIVVFYERGTPEKNEFFKKLSKLAAKKQEFKIPAIPKKDAASQALFALGDFWGRRERKKAILGYHALISAGVSADRILHTLMWHVRTLFDVREKRAKKLHPFVARKAADQARNFTKEGLREAYDALLDVDVKAKWSIGDEENNLLHFFLTK
ncbi:MAG: hypothetical protein HYT34_00560 [Candidatus Ryanbacteria bacterium]|nr:hypothetical protein [Candidatus Ryanbacteria bacterium]